MLSRYFETSSRSSSACAAAACGVAVFVVEGVAAEPLSLLHAAIAKSPARTSESRRASGEMRIGESSVNKKEFVWRKSW
jgi:hypothetical protein